MANLLKNVPKKGYEIIAKVTIFRDLLLWPMAIRAKRVYYKTGSRVIVTEVSATFTPTQKYVSCY